MRIQVIAVGRAGSLLGEATADYEARAGRYWNLEIIEVKGERAGRGASAARVRAAEGDRILQRVGPGLELWALTRNGEGLSSAALAKQLAAAAAAGRPGVAFAIGGAVGLSDSVLRAARRQVRLSDFTLPHELARLVLAEQLYRAGTIARGEPYHKGSE
ncbi:MAG: 23S rRNA (pseudouridine(1915)-N(3))-methyltransferase RlmH [Gemmatimonadetes bacterium]|nr:23S rRNA (pseudouridine(1915)-N(3))-methyltransferase RlmH [Gemmatimonadota bacterium]